MAQKSTFDSQPTNYRPFGEPLVAVEWTVWRDLWEQGEHPASEGWLDALPLNEGALHTQRMIDLTLDLAQGLTNVYFSVQFTPLCIVDQREGLNSSWPAIVSLQAHLVSLTPCSFDLGETTAEDRHRIWTEIRKSIQTECEAMGMETRL